MNPRNLTNEELIREHWLSENELLAEFAKRLEESDRENKRLNLEVGACKSQIRKLRANLEND